MWTFFKRQTHIVPYTDDHTEEVVCCAISRDGKKAITGGHLTVSPV